MTLIPTVLMSLLMALAPTAALAAVTLVEAGPAGTSQAVAVDNAALAHTSQMLPLNANGEVVGKGDPVAQANQMFMNLSTALAEAHSELSQVIKLNVYAVDAGTVAKVQQAIAARFNGQAIRPAVSFVTGRLAHPDALVAMDAIALNSEMRNEVKRFGTAKLSGMKGASQVAILPRGSKVFVSGQAEKGTLLEATRKTLESLSKTLAHLGLKDSDVVQVKAFLTPMTSVAEVEREMLKYFGNAAPPMVFVEWTSNIPIEIELIASGGAAKSKEPIEFITPPDMKASPVYCRVTRINRDPIIYFSGLHGRSTQNGKLEVKEIFEQLTGLAGKSGTDLKHLAKATYYTSATDASNELNAQRPNYYDPARPPAASKAQVAGVGIEGKTITLDMIAVGK